MKHVLIADDEAGVRKFVSLMLKRGGYAVSEAEDGRRALELIIAKADDPEESIDLLVTDVTMPRMSGEELIQTMWKSGISIPIIIITGDDEVGQLRDRLGEGNYEFLDKMSVTAKIAGRVNELLTD